MTPEEKKLNEDVKSAAKIGGKLALVVAAEIPIVGGVLSGVGGIIMDEYEPEPLNEDDVQRLIDESKHKNAQTAYRNKCAYFKQVEQYLRSWNGDAIDFKEELISLENDIESSEGFMPNKRNYKNAETFYALPYFVIWANVHLVALRMKMDLEEGIIGHKTKGQYKDDFQKKIIEYTKYLYNAFSDAVSWRLDQIKAGFDSGFAPQFRDWEIVTTGSGKRLRASYEVEVNNSDAMRLNTIPISRSDSAKFASGYSKIAKDIKNQWKHAVKTEYIDLVGVVDVLEQWVKKCPAGTIPKNWKLKILEWSFLREGMMLVTIQAKFGSAGGQYLSHAGKNVQLKSMSRPGSGELFVVENTANQGECHIRTMGGNMGGYLSHGHGSLAVKFHPFDGEKWTVIHKSVTNLDITTAKQLSDAGQVPKYHYKMVLRAKGTHDMIGALSGETGKLLVHNGGNLELGGLSINCAFWNINIVSGNRATER